MEFIIFMVVMLIFAIVGISGVTILVKFIQAKDKSEVFTTRNFFRIYLYLMTFVSLAVFTLGIAQLLKAGLSYLVAPDFSYSTYETSPRPYSEKMPPGEPADLIIDRDADYDECYGNAELIELDDKNVCFDNVARRRDLLSGITLSLTMILIFAVHRFGLYYMQRKDMSVLLKKMYDFASLGLYSIISLVAIPTAIYQTIDYILIKSEESIDYSGSRPGEFIAIVLVVVPLWFIFLGKMYLDNSDKKEVKKFV